MNCRRKEHQAVEWFSSGLAYFMSTEIFLQVDARYFVTGYERESCKIGGGRMVI